MRATLILVALIIGNSWIHFAAANITLNQNLSHYRCDSRCVIEDLPAVVERFERHTSREKNESGVIDLKLQLDHHYNSSRPCQNDSFREPILSNSSMLWVVDKTRENHSHFGLYVFWKLVVRLNCTTKPSGGSVGTSLYDAVIGTLIKDLGRSTGGTLCFPWKSEGSVSKYKCCDVNEFSSGKDCEIHRSSSTDPSSSWLRLLKGLVITLALVIIPLYLPAVICLFPYPKVSVEGINCIKLDDPSPAGIRSLIVKALVPPNKYSIQSYVRILFFRVIFIPGLACLPIVISSHDLMSIFTSPSYIYFYCGYVLESMVATFWPKPQKPCKYCRILFSDSVVHSTLAEKVKAHLSMQLYFCVTSCRLFSIYYLNVFKKPLSLELSTSRAAMRLCKTIYFAVILVPAFLGFIAGNSLVLLFSFVVTCPIFDINHYDRRPNYYSRILKYRCRNFGHFEQDIVYGLARVAERAVLCISSVAVGLMAYFCALASGALLTQGVVLIIVNAEVLFPYVAMTVLVLYYICGCFSLFTEKYQLLKIKLYQSCKKYQQCKETSEDETMLILYTKDKDVALPEELYEAAIQELRIPIMRNLWMALLKMLGILIVAICIFSKIMLTSNHVGTAPLIQTVFVFMAGSLPKMFSVFSSGESKQKLEELSMEEQLDYVVAEYVHNQLRNSCDTQKSIIEMTDADVAEIEMEERSEHSREVHIKLLDEVKENSDSTV